MGTSPCAPPPRHICALAAAWDEVPTLAMANGPARPCRALTEEILPNHCTTRTAPARALLAALLWDNHKDQDVDRTTPSHKPFPEAPPGVQLSPTAPAEHPKLTRFLSPLLRAVPFPTCRGNRRFPSPKGVRLKYTLLKTVSNNRSE